MTRYRKKKEEIPVEEWLAYKRNPTKEFQSKVVKQYSYIPRTIAYEYAHKKPYMLELDDLIQAGLFGLFQAIDRYNPESGVQFNTFATFRIRGAIIDQINAVDWTPRPVRERIKKVLETIELLKREQSEDDEVSIDATSISKHLQEDKKEKYRLDIDEVETVLQQLKKTYISHMDPETMNSMEDDGSLNPDMENLSTIMNMVLDMTERTIIEMKYFGGYRNKEISERLNIKLTQIQIIEKSALEKLARNLPERKS